MSKYGAKKTIIDNVTFDSKREAAHYQQLKMLQRAGAIADLTLQPEFVIWDGGRDRDGKKLRPIIYRADFMHHDCKTGQNVVTDVKGVRTPVYLMKKKMFLVRYPEYLFEEV